ncbi:hypothetical protein CBR_g81560 [Chara braunii]|uniref:Ubiquitin-like protease family profile domain-containing protein n=1 Tax=Chara braunii TaxID=69332 RepID=A0A388KAW1_CHABU|nr:hypothetical protein CBR_g81560 [Chara braunii]|eukprot:GBG67136.1 hypothetical protein CBR_g81560 [Chara braunii]
MAARLRSGEWVPMGWMPSGVVEHWHFMVVLARVSICNARVNDKALLCKHAKLCWDRLNAHDRQMVLCGYDGRDDENMWSMQGAGVGANPCSDFPDNCLSIIRRRHGRSALLGWVPVVFTMRYAYGADLSIEFRDPLGVPFFVTYSDGLLRHIEYMAAKDMKGNDYNAGIREPQFEETGQPACEANRPPGDAPVGCDLDGPTAHSGAGRVVVEKSALVTGTVCTDGSRRTGQGTKRKATTKPDNGGTMTVAGRGGRGKGRGGGAAMVGGRGRGRGRGQGGAAMDGETGGKIDGRQGPPRRNRRLGKAASGGEDKNLIHEALHEVTEEAIAAAEVVDVECVKDHTLDLVSRTPVSPWNICEAVEELTAASTDVDRRRKGKEGWQMLVAEQDTARTHTTDTTVQDRGATVSLVDARTVLKNPAANAATVHGGFREWRLAPRHPSRDFNEGVEQASQQGDDVVVPCDEKGDAQTGPQQENPTSWESGVSGSDISSDEVGKEYDPYWDVKRGGGQGSKGWCHAILRLARVFSKPHPLIRVVDKVATPDGRRMSHIMRNSTKRSALAADMTTRRGKRSRTTRMRTTEEKKNVGDDSVAEVTIDCNQEKTISTKQDNSERSKVETQKVDKGASHTEKRPQATTREGEEATERTAAKCRIMTMEAMLERWEHLSQKDPWYKRMYLAATRGTIRSADLGPAESCGKTTQTKKGENASTSSDGFEVVDETNIYPLMWKGKREEIRLAETDVMCLAVGKWLNDNVMDMYLFSIYEEQLQGKDTATVHVCTTFWHPVVLANQKVDTVKRGWELRVKSRTTKIHRLCKDLEAAPVVLIPINHKHHWMLLIMLNVREFWTDDTCLDAIIVDSCDGYATPDWRALWTLMWHEYLNDKRRGPDVARQLVNKSWNTCRDVFGRGLIHARSSQQSKQRGLWCVCMLHGRRVDNKVDTSPNREWHIERRHTEDCREDAHRWKNHWILS